MLAISVGASLVRTDERIAPADGVAAVLRYATTCANVPLTLRWRRDLNPRTVLAVSRFQGECIRPLCHATVDKVAVTPGRRPYPVVAWPACAPSSPNRPINWSGKKYPMSSAGPGEVLIKVAAAGVNRADVLQAAGKYPPPPGASEIIGMEVSGVIAEVGSGVTEWSVGQEVCASAGRRRIRRIRRRSRRPGPADSRRRRAGRRCRVTRSGVHRVVESGVDRSPERRPVAADARRGQRHRNPRDPGRARVGRPGGGHRRFGGEAGNLSRPGRRRSPSTIATKISSRGCGRRPAAPT